MNTRKIFSLTVFAIAAGISITACAAGDHKHMSTPAAAGVSTNPTSGPTVPAALPMTDGEIRKVDGEANKITIKHGEIKNLEMPGMTMVFQLKDSSMANSVKAGDKVKFTAEKIGGAYVVTHIQKAD